MNVARPLIDLKQTKKCFVGIDSDGCVFDSMGIKQRECFCPMLIGCFGLQPVAQAARENNALFYPINPGHETSSWKRFCQEGFDRFVSGAFAGDYQNALLAEFDGYLPETPPWKT